mmetsp:Transcript_27812/g.80658  ORF Transcript_27812/g.80658 Transcript_27812/m.80658 type:complete len:311 (+) Transcript_27812:156-1088(+)
MAVKAGLRVRRLLLRRGPGRGHDRGVVVTAIDGLDAFARGRPGCDLEAEGLLHGSRGLENAGAAIFAVPLASRGQGAPDEEAALRRERHRVVHACADGLPVAPPRHMREGEDAAMGAVDRVAQHAALVLPGGPQGPVRLHGQDVPGPRAEVRDVSEHCAHRRVALRGAPRDAHLATVLLPPSEQVAVLGQCEVARPVVTRQLAHAGAIGEVQDFPCGQGVDRVGWRGVGLQHAAVLQQQEVLAIGVHNGADRGSCSPSACPEDGHRLHYPVVSYGRLGQGQMHRWRVRSKAHDEGATPIVGQKHRRGVRR